MYFPPQLTIGGMGNVVAPPAGSVAEPPQKMDTISVHVVRESRLW